jgi:hypothetical protein
MIEGIKNEIRRRGVAEVSIEFLLYELKIPTYGFLPAPNFNSRAIAHSDGYLMTEINRGLRSYGLGADLTVNNICLVWETRA